MKKFYRRFLLLPALCASMLLPASFPAMPAHAADLVEQYDWKPVRLGAGGFVTGLVIHPLDPNVRYCRTDVGNAYRWDAKLKEWMPLVVRVGVPGAATSSGVPAEIAVAPSKIGVESIAVDPKDVNTVLISFPAGYSSSDKSVATRLAGSVFRSTDGGRNFRKSDLNVKMAPNGAWRHKGECMGIDPANPQVVFYGSRENGLWKSADGGMTWKQLTAGGAPASTANVIGIRFDSVSPESSTTYAVVEGGSVLKSTDSGDTWTDVASAAAGGPGQGSLFGNSFVDQNGNLFIMKAKTMKIHKMTREGKWSELSPNFGSSGNTSNGIAVDPANPQRLFAVGSGGSISRSVDGGLSWVPLGNHLKFGNTFGWLPQMVKGSPNSWRSTGGILFDSTSRLWVPQGNEGVLSAVPSPDDTETSANPLKWEIDSKGIEEFVTHDVAILPKSQSPTAGEGTGDTLVVAIEDATAFLIKNPDNFDTVHSNLQTQLISNGTSVAFCPNAPHSVAVASADVHHTGSGKDYSGISLDGGKTWNAFPTQPVGAKAGTIAISRRDGWGDGADHLIWYPLGNRPPQWSHDGGKTWALCGGFPVKENGSFDEKISGYWNGSLKQRALVADPHVADRFFLYTIWGGAARLYRTDDGGRNWIPLPEAGLPIGGHHAQIAANPFVKGEYWFVDGWEGGVQNGLWHSADGGNSYTRVDGVDRAVTLAVGKGTGTGAANKGALYIYGRLSASPDWGVFRSTDSGATWDRISYYPAGQIDIPTCMAASQDTFGFVAIGLSGNSFIYGKLR